MSCVCVCVCLCVRVRVLCLLTFHGAILGFFGIPVAETRTPFSWVLLLSESRATSSLLRRGAMSCRLSFSFSAFTWMREEGIASVRARLRKRERLFQNTKKKNQLHVRHAHPVYLMCTLHTCLTPSPINLNPIYAVPFCLRRVSQHAHAGAFADRDPLCAPITRAHTFTSSSLHFASSASSSLRLGGGGCARTRRR